MRLSKLKMAGFKSFVDPTTVSLPSELIGVVGPNGCGKSNIIDAVRWVMGESSAKHLRGDSMADVIFNGSSTRKPVGQASVELVFDNSDGSLGGQYANYAEIAIKRQVSRDGQSHYFLNGTRCRRRDITDIFLGTGLGPRSYAIIEQGTISRIIEAKPEELRVFLEEAAGISKYKERRKETENRIRHSRDNLDRLNDLREELDKQLAHLQRQAKTAEKYKVLKEEERLLKAQLQALRWQNLNEKASGVENKLRERETALEEARAKQRKLETEIEHQREAHGEAAEAFNEVQGRYYSVGSDIARLEQSIQHAKERRQQQQRDLAQLEKDLNESQEHLSADRERKERLSAELAEIEPRLQQAQSEEQGALARLQENEQAMQRWQAEMDEFNQRAAEPAQIVEVERARITHLDERITQVQARRQRVDEELNKVSTAELDQQASQLKLELSDSEQLIQQHQEKIEQQQRRIAELRDEIKSLSARLEEAREQLQDLNSRNASLEALQQAALGKEQAGVRAWLENQRLAEAKRLAESIEVDSGWERAAECVLGVYLEAVCVNDVDAYVHSLGQLNEGQLILLEDSGGASAQHGAKASSLAQKIRSPMSLDAILHNVYAVDSLGEAMQLRQQLAAHESVVTRDGIWLGPNWIRVINEGEEHAGILQREQELKTLAQAIDTANQEMTDLQARLETATNELHTLETAREAEQQAQQAATRQQADQQASMGALQARLDQMHARQAQLRSEREEIQTQLDNDTQNKQAAEAKLRDAQDRMGGLEQQRQDLITRRDELQTHLQQAKEQAQVARQAAADVRVRSETLRTELNSTEQTLQRMDARLNQLTTRREELQQALNEGDQPLADMAEQLNEMLKQRVEVENELNGARNAMQQIEHKMRELEEQRAQAEEAVQAVRNELEEIRIGWQEVKVRRQTILEQINAAGYQVEALLQEMPEHANEADWEEEVAKMERRIQRLGAINLAAIEEFEQQSERKKYLDAQHEDLIEALTTLENAIAKIDRETRTRFKETFDKVNKGLQELFPRLFGGGHAYLEMTEDDLLETGIAVMARPPGKRNSTIHLLSGGEKALTAVALVFAIFELNPSPFCMLDEVDAPLDDLNVTRYCDLLRHMSSRIQFIFITHNKITMEVANHLTGVTMNEPGVSRMVAVDVDEAVQLAAV